MLTIYRSEASASLRRVPMWLVLSNGTAPATAEAAGQPQISWHPRGTATVNTSGTLSLLSANAGLYHVELTASEVSALGVFSVQFRSATAIAQTVFGKIVNYDSGDSVRFGQFALPNVAADAAGGLIVMGTGTNQLQPSLGSVGLRAIIHSQATVGGADNITPRNYSGISVEIRTGGIQTTSYGIGNYSGVSFEVKSGGIQTTSVGVGTYSSVTIQGLSNYANISNVTLAAGTHSDVTIKGIENYANISSVTLNIGTHSGATVQGVTRVNSSVTPADATYSAVTVRIEGVNYSGATIDGVRMLATPGERSIASSLLSTSLGGTTARMVQQAFELLRNRVLISGSTMTVFQSDDLTSSWTGTISTGTATVYGVTPGLA